VAKPSSTANLTRSSLLWEELDQRKLENKSGKRGSHVDDDGVGRSVGLCDGKSKQTNGPSSENKNCLSSSDVGTASGVKDDRERLDERRGFVGARVGEFVKVGDGVVEKGLEGAILMREDLGRRVEAHCGT
jgi:hypothetical protein